MVITKAASKRIDFGRFMRLPRFCQDFAKIDFRIKKRLFAGLLVNFSFAKKNRLESLYGFVT